MVNLIHLPGGRNCRFRVIATDGVNTAADESNAALEVGRKPPQVSIVAPESGAVLTLGSQFIFVGQGTDPDGDPIPESSFVWTSSRQGEFGIGARVDASNLSPGDHEIVLTVTDSDGLTAQARITVTVREREPVPACVGDCDGDGQVTIEEIIKMVNVALELQPVGSCAAGDANSDGAITVDEIILAVNKALNGC
ncbi:MAG: hypothetical protein N3C12_07265 [Candidatus Binatia bacterium]|nr:hypothetical protein [Candidatus Binatia bacterium]